MRSVVVAAFLLLGSVPAGAAEPVCKVNDRELIGDFAGACDADGFASGPGAAKGIAEYVGEFERGMKHGRGVKVWPSGDRYVGEFVADMKQGRGIYSFGPGSAWKGDFYVGEFANDMRHGDGVYHWANGDQFSGKWDKDRMVGTMTPMQTLQHKHLQEVAKAVKVVGARVCRDERVGTVHAARLEGVVETVIGDMVRFRLADGRLIEEHYSQLRPCN